MNEDVRTNAFLAIRVRREYAISIGHNTLSPVRTLYPRSWDRFRDPRSGRRCAVVLRRVLLRKGDPEYVLDVWEEFPLVIASPAAGRRPTKRLER